MYEMVGISKQGHYKRVAYQERMIRLADNLMVSASQIRKEHPRLGCRKMFHEIQPEGLGKHRSEAILLANGFRVRRKRKYCRTTYAGRWYYENHISGLKVTDINQLWVSDITFIPISYRKWYYLTLIQDVYSRKVVGWSLAATQGAEATVVSAYKKALEINNKNHLRGLIFHSDRGSQYIWGNLKRLHEDHGVIPSMGGKAWENAHAESINGILKNEYIDFEGSELCIHQARKTIEGIIRKYNEKRPHGSLQNMKPVEFETHIKQLKDKQKPIVKINY
jgi:transposase InsO family protein